MNNKLFSKEQWWLLAGDVAAVAVVTVWGFASHRTLGTAGWRMLSTFVPVLVAWWMVGPFLGVYDFSRATDCRQLWRPFWAMVLAGPMAALLRAFWLGGVIVPLFVIVLGGVGALGIALWRGVFCLLYKRRAAKRG